MEQNFYLGFLILYVSLSFEVKTSFAIINYIPYEDGRVELRVVPYIVNIVKDTLRHCAGSILGTNIIITTADCVEREADYVIKSGSDEQTKGKYHRIVNKTIHGMYRIAKFTNDVALLKIAPPINLVDSPNRAIEIYNRTLLPMARGGIAGWGCNGNNEGIWNYPRKLQATTVEILDNRECAKLFHGIRPITDENICTRDPRLRKGLCEGDSGTGLVVEDQLIGVASYIGYMENLPDVYIKLDDPNKKVWINVIKNRYLGRWSV